VRLSSLPEPHAVARKRAAQLRKNTARRVWKAVENLCLPDTGICASAGVATHYVMLTTHRPSVDKVETRTSSVEIASRLSDDRIQETLQVIRAVERDSYDTPIISLHLHLDVGLEFLAKLVLHAL